MIIFLMKRSSKTVEFCVDSVGLLEAMHYHFGRLVVATFNEPYALHSFPGMEFGMRETFFLYGYRTGKLGMCAARKKTLDS